ncbi:hypothetical protein IB254_22055 [Pseudomonas sp. PDM03]|uniref:hypothetical protein n=1 Tax=Pseudomonas sp. PDM03 TaxID=2769266 RepID=UPI00177CD00D|nr:hypothetical protein [Pseudomonas sp. PDM03]MBD9589770.1 hypothetical protein [Pseudomonas sp. PDM03]
MKTIIRHESEEDFFARMTSLAKKLDRREAVEAYESFSFEDVGEMKAFRSEQERKARKASFTLITGGGKAKVRSKGPHTYVTNLRRFKTARWINATVTFERDAKQILKNYATTTQRFENGLIVGTRVGGEADRPLSSLRDK